MVIGVGPEYVVVYLPSADPATLTINWNGVAFYTPNNDGKTSQAEWPAYVDEFTEINARNPIWQRLGDPTHTVPAACGPGDTSIPFQRLVQIDISVINVGDQVSRNWLPSDFGNYGTVRGTKDGVAGKLQFIQSKRQAFNYNAGDVDGVIVTMKPACIAIATLMPWLGIPPVVWAVNGGTKQISNSPYPFFGILPT